MPSFLKQLDLEAFETAFNDCGYDSVPDTLRELTPEDFITLVKDTGSCLGPNQRLKGLHSNGVGGGGTQLEEQLSRDVPELEVHQTTTLQSTSKFSDA